jgi:endonuclease-3
MPAKQDSRLARVLDVLETHYGAPRAPRGVRSAFEWILWEKVGYLVDDEQRAAAFRELASSIGTTPGAILAASKASLTAVACGMHPSRSADELKLAAEIAEREHSGALDAFLDDEPARALAALKKYPGIGEPGAEKILLFTGRAAVPALESNGVRALLRLGFAREAKSYAASYKNLRAAILPECKLDCAWLARMHRLLRLHGQTLCKNSRPSCDACPLEDDCDYAAS